MSAARTELTRIVIDAEVPGVVYDNLAVFDVRPTALAALVSGASAESGALLLSDRYCPNIGCGKTNIVCSETNVCIGNVGCVPNIGC